MNLNNIKIYTNSQLLDNAHEVIIYEGHPFVQWLARFLPFDPNINYDYYYKKPSTKVLVAGNKYVMHPALEQKFRNTIGGLKEIVKHGAM